MDYKKFQYFILCEDKSQYDFAEGWLKAKGVNVRKIYPIGAFPHEGCGYAWVRDQLPRLTATIKAKNRGETNTCLIVFCDADTRLVKDVEDELRIERDDPVFLIIAKRNLQTWIRFIRNPTESSSRDEQNDCKLQYCKVPYGKLGAELAMMIQTSRDMSSCCPQSLKRTIARIIKKKTIF